MKDMEVEVMFGDNCTATIKTNDARAIFRLIKGLQSEGWEPTIRYFDEELGEKTCWQPTKPQKPRLAA